MESSRSPRTAPPSTSSIPSSFNMTGAARPWPLRRCHLLPIQSYLTHIISQWQNCLYERNRHCLTSLNTVQEENGDSWPTLENTFCVMYSIYDFFFFAMLPLTLTCAAVWSGLMGESLPVLRAARSSSTLFLLATHCGCFIAAGGVAPPPLAASCPEVQCDCKWLNLYD